MFTSIYVYKQESTIIQLEVVVYSGANQHRTIMNSGGDGGIVGLIIEARYSNPVPLTLTAAGSSHSCSEGIRISEKRVLGDGQDLIRPCSLGAGRGAVLCLAWNFSGTAPDKLSGWNGTKGGWGYRWGDGLGFEESLQRGSPS